MNVTNRSRIFKRSRSLTVFEELIKMDTDFTKQKAKIFISATISLVCDLAPYITTKYMFFKYVSLLDGENVDLTQKIVTLSLFDVK